ncbi:peptidoglycan endopeptidase [Flavobacterium sp. K5-23]|uniref:peptidoglycan endopeptidase n=1 Tax=Flavobacterium sp. K5-23 TaxID=2746225 RepID=UPI00200C2DF9|nr:peptidoglycan endopeptidase [Flavobacterium sp. K5-23]UQD54880.1 LysM peptidoglycan-binding domain-containing protein [Flavobacterium sp. K5-23]
MRNYSWIVAMFFIGSFYGFSQEKQIKHTIMKGETITKIAEQYNVKPKAIYDLNPQAKKLLKLNSVLLIPTVVSQNTNTTTNNSTTFSETTHEVLVKETPYGIAKEYGISVAELYEVNPSLEKTGLKTGQKIQIPGTAANSKIKAITSEPQKELKTTKSQEKVISKASAPVTEVAVVKNEMTTQEISREVLKGETKYAIAKEYGITVAEIDKANPILETEALKVGQVITIPVKGKEVVKTADNKVAIDKQVSKTELVVNTPVTVEDSFSRKVLAKETKYSIAKQYGITVKELEKQNPKIAKKLLVGSVLTIRGIEVKTETAVVAEVVKEEISATPNSSRKSITDMNFLDQLVSAASDNIGSRYRTGGTSKSGFDCSGLIVSTYGGFDIKLPRSSIEMSNFGSVISTGEAQKGDLIFFKTNGRRRINHVGMVVDVTDGEIKFIHSSNHGGVIISSIKENYYSKSFAQVNRVLEQL